MRVEWRPTLGHQRRPVIAGTGAAVTEYTMSVDDVKALGAKLDAAGLSESEKAFLAAAVDLAAKSSDADSEVEGFGFSRGYSFAAVETPSLSVGFLNAFRPNFPHPGPGPGPTQLGGTNSIIIVGG